MLQKLPVNNLQQTEDTSQFNKDFIKNYNEENDETYFLQVDVQYPEKVRDLHNDITFLRERIKIKNVEKFAANLHDKTEYIIDIRNLKQALNHGLVLKKFLIQGLVKVIY